MAGVAGPEAARAYERLLERARTDPAILAFWLGGSRGMGRPTGEGLEHRRGAHRKVDARATLASLITFP